MKNLFVPGMSDVHRGELTTLSADGDCTFHGLLDYERLVNNARIDFRALLDDARRELAGFDGTVDGILVHWDFPASIIGPLVARDHDLAAPSLESLLKCEHKYWSRLEQEQSIPECVPDFCAFDPFDDDALAKVRIEFPFWVKPVKAHSSNLGFEVHDAEQFHEAVAQIRTEIESMGDAFNEAMSLADLPEWLSGIGGNTCLAEQLITGTQAAIEGAMYRGGFYPHGIIDMRKDDAGTSFDRLEYPAGTVPARVQDDITAYTERFLRHIGFDDGCFNAEYMWDAETGRLWMVEVNTRISQAHSDLFAKVDGVSNHKVALDIALGREPSMPHREGPFAVAAQCMVFHDEDAVVTKVPGIAELDALRERIPEMVVATQARVGDRLSRLLRQNSYRYIVAKAYIGAADRSELDQRCRDVAAAMPFEYQPVER